ncbi:MAG: hypothetical protein NVSMB1_06180 [Polyangiales bacterium]
MTWSELCASEEFRGRWVALDHCRYDEATAKPIAGNVVDVDDDVVELCNRVRDAEHRECAILFIEAYRSSQPLSSRSVH